MMAAPRPGLSGTDRHVGRLELLLSTEPKYDIAPGGANHDLRVRWESAVAGVVRDLDAVNRPRIAGLDR